MPRFVLKATEFVTAFFAGFGSFLTGIAPPDDGFSVGLASWLLTLTLLLVWSALLLWSNQSRYRPILFLLSVVFVISAILSGVFYGHERSRLTYWYPPEKPRAEYVAGFDFTPEAQALSDQHQSVADIVANLGGENEVQRTFPLASINSARTYLTALYLLLCLSIGGAAFALGEGLLPYPTSSPQIEDMNAQIKTAMDTFKAEVLQAITNASATAITQEQLDEFRTSLKSEMADQLILQFQQLRSDIASDISTVIRSSGEGGPHGQPSSSIS